MSAGVGLPLAFTTVALVGSGIFVLVRRIRDSGATRGGDEQTTRARSDVISRVAAVVAVGLVVTLANLNSFPGVAQRSFASWLMVSLLSLLPLLGGIYLLLQYVRRRIGSAEFNRLATTASVSRPVLPGGAGLRIVFVFTLIMIVVVATVAFRFGLDHVVF